MGKGTEPAIVDADVGGLDMEIPDKINRITVLFPANMAGKHSKQAETGFFEKQKAFVGSQSFTFQDFTDPMFQWRRDFQMVEGPLYISSVH